MAVRYSANVWLAPGLGMRNPLLCSSRVCSRQASSVSLLNDARERSWLTEDACLEKTRLLQSTGFRIPKPGANQTFAEYLTAIE